MATSENKEWTYAVVYDLAPSYPIPSRQAARNRYGIYNETKENTVGHPVDTLERVDVYAPSSTGHPNVLRHVCKTQPPVQVSPRSIYVGENDTANRFVKGSVITFNVNRDSFRSSEDAKYAAKSLRKAAKAWNWGEIGVTFREVSDNEPAVFQLVYSEDKPRWLAHAFFPDEVLGRQQPKLYVFRSAFKREYHGWMVGIFCHELGHILGLRHEFAQRKPGELEMPSVQIGEDNDSSIMNYFSDPSKWCIQKSDFDGVREFYAFDGKYYGNFRIRDVVPRGFAPSPRHHGISFLMRLIFGW